MPEPDQATKEAQKCLLIKDDGEAFACVKKVVREFKKSKNKKPGPRLVLLVSEGCTPCEEEAALHQEEIDEGTIAKIDFASEEGIVIASKNNLEYTPSLILIDGENKIIEGSA